MKGHMRLSVLAVEMFVLSVTLSEIITYELHKVPTHFESLTLKMKINGFDDLCENWKANLSCQHT